MQAIDAIAFAINLQEELMEVAWPEDLLLSSHACSETSATGGKLFAGLRVRCAIHTGIPDSIKVGDNAYHAFLMPVQARLMGLLM